MKDRDVVSWNTMISGYVHASDLLEATKLFSEMSNPDALSWNSINLRICTGRKDGNRA